MRKMGWEGSSIGKNGGLSKPIIAVKRVDGVGLGMYIYIYIYGYIYTNVYI
jgi:hypothetical protein